MPSQAAVSVLDCKSSRTAMQCNCLEVQVHLHGWFWPLAVSHVSVGMVAFLADQVEHACHGGSSSRSLGKHCFCRLFLMDDWTPSAGSMASRCLNAISLKIVQAPLSLGPSPGIWCVHTEGLIGYGVKRLIMTLERETASLLRRLQV